MRPSIRRNGLRMAALLLASTSPLAMAADCVPGDAATAGHYYLSGVTEVGSELLLRPDGHFQYMMSFGAVDQTAHGCWRHEGAGVVLTSSAPATDVDMVFNRHLPPEALPPGTDVNV